MSDPQLPGDEPVDVTAVARDDALIERLRASLSPDTAVVWGDDDDDSGEDLSYALLRALQHDVSAALPQPAPTPAVVVPLAARRSGLRRTATVAAMTAGVLSLAGAAAAATSSPGDPMYGVRSAVASAVSEVVDAITPSEPIGPKPAAHRAATPTATITPPGVAVSTAARSISAVRQIEERISTAKRLLEAERPRAALQVLAQAERRLPLVTDAAVRAGLQGQVDALQAQAAAASTVAPDRTPRDKPDDKGTTKADGKKATPRPTRAPAAERRTETPRVGESARQSDGDKRLLPELPAVADDRRHAADR